MYFGPNYMKNIPIIVVASTGRAPTACRSQSLQVESLEIMLIQWAHEQMV